MKYIISMLVFGIAVCCALSHDTWVQTNTRIIRPGDAIHIDLMLGNHGNDHRDFKLASKLSPELIKTFEVRDPDGKVYDLKPDMADLGYAPKEGFYSSRFVAGKKGLHVACQTLDKVINHGKPIHAYRSAKAYFLVSESLDSPASGKDNFSKAMGHDIELIPLTNPVLDMGPGKEIQVKLVFKGQPLPNTGISFIPRGVNLKAGFDPEYERKTDKDGIARFTPKFGTYYLVVAHHPVSESGPNFESEHYTATMTFLVPQRCECCD